MATTRYPFLPEQASFPTTNMPGVTTVKTTNGIPRTVLAFDAATDESCAWTFIAPQGLTGVLSAIITLAGNAASTNATYWEVSLEALSSGDGDIDATDDGFATVNTGNTAMPATQGNITQLTVTLTNNDSIAAGDLCRLKLTRDANNGSDNFAADAYVLAVELQEA